MAYTKLSALNIMFDLTFTDKKKVVNRDSTEGWQRRIAQFFALPSLTIFFPLELIVMPFKLARNLLKLLFVFLIFVGCNLFLQPIFNEHYQNVIDEELSSSEKSLSVLVMLGLGLLLGLLYAVGYASQLLLSPIDTVMGLWNTGRRTGSHLHLFFAVAAGVAVGVAYMLLAPMAIYALGPLVLAKLATFLPAVMTHAIQAAISAIGVIGQAISPICELIGSYTFISILAPLGLTAAQVGFGELIGLMAFCIGSAIALVSDRVSEWYRSEPTKPIVIAVEEVDDVHPAENESTRVIDNTLLSVPENTNTVVEEPVSNNDMKQDMQDKQDKQDKNPPVIRSAVKSKILKWNSNQYQVGEIQKQANQLKHQ